MIATSPDCPLSSTPERTKLTSEANISVNSFDVYFVFSNATVAIATIASEEEMNVATRARCSCNVARVKLVVKNATGESPGKARK